ncbi:InlB B-repeat-containing protein [Fibrobacter sp. UWB11]|uniref:InlB B-repeat-containing protein n=1 Tax=Fibrobacter sp. UWB11 TaxID=1896202 RepID=UPI0009258781|nr:InlB B-repeat-containing protein [Fibrobacter sp. UWB11]SIN93181.1 repeat domain (List_Bact_rpt) [Fibrobacter sp. UWB11]
MNKVMGRSLALLLCAGSLANIAAKNDYTVINEEDRWNYIYNNLDRKKMPLDTIEPISVKITGSKDVYGYPTGEIYYNDNFRCGTELYRNFPSFVSGVIGQGYGTPTGTFASNTFTYLIAKNSSGDFDYGWYAGDSKFTTSWASKASTSNYNGSYNIAFLGDCGSHKIDPTIKDVIKAAEATGYSRARLTIDLLNYITRDESLDQLKSMWVSNNEDWNNYHLGRAFYYLYLSKATTYGGFDCVSTNCPASKTDVYDLYGNSSNTTHRSYEFNFRSNEPQFTYVDVAYETRRYTYSKEQGKYVPGKWESYNQTFCREYIGYDLGSGPETSSSCDKYDDVTIKVTGSNFGKTAEQKFFEHDSLDEFRVRWRTLIAEGQTNKGAHDMQVWDTTYSDILKFVRKYYVSIGGNQAEGSVDFNGGFYNAGTKFDKIVAVPKAGYVFDRWNISADNGGGVLSYNRALTDFVVRGDSTLYAIFAKKTDENTHVVTFTDFDGIVLGRDTVLTGHPAIAPNAPSRKGLTFKGWDKAFNKVTEDITVKAVYESMKLTHRFSLAGFKTAESADDVTLNTPNNCFVVSNGHFNESGMPLDYRVDVTVKNTGACAQNEQVNVWFNAGDLKKLDIVVGGVEKFDVSALSLGNSISKVEFWFKRFEVQFMVVNLNGNLGYSTMKKEYVPEGMSATPPPPDEVPAQRGFVFSEWGTDYSKIVKNTTVAAQYRELKSFWVHFRDYDESVILDSLYYQGDKVVIPEKPEHSGLTFKGWDNMPDVFEYDKVTEITATYEAKSNPEFDFTVADYKTAKTVSDLDVQGPNKCFVLQEKSFMQYDKEKDYAEGKEDALQYHLAVNFKIEDSDECSNDSLVNIWKFNIQNKVASTVKVNGVEDVIWNAGSSMGYLHFNYTWFRIRFLGDDRVVSSDGTVIKENTILKTELVGQGLSATPPEDTKLRCKIFKQWDRKYTEIKSSYNVYGEYENTPSKKVTFKDFDGSVLQDSVYCDDEIVVAPKDPVHKGLIFKGWDQKVEEIESSTSVTATYEVEKAPEYSFTVTNYEKAVKATDANVKTPNNCFVVATQAFKDLSDGYDYTEGNKDPWRYILEVEVDVADTGSCANDSLANIWRFYSKTDHNLDVMVNTLKAKDLFIQILTIEKIGVKFQYLWYPVVFADYDGKVLKTEIVGEKQAATPPKDPTRSLYKFKGWKFIDEGVGYECISSNMLGRGASINNQITFVADYEKLPTVVVTFLDFNGTLVGKEEILKGASETSVKPPVHAGLTFVGWSKDLNLITKNDSVYAVYKVAATPDFVYTISGLEVGKSSKDLKIKTPNSCFKASVKELYLDNKKYEGKLEAGKYVMYMNLAVSDTDKCADDSLVNIWKTLSQKNINDILVINGNPAYFSGEKLNGEIVYSFELKKSDKESIPGVKMAPQFKLATIGRNIQVMNARKGSAYAVLDMQGNVITSGTVDSANFNVTMSRSGAYVVRVGSVAQLVRVK